MVETFFSEPIFAEIVLPFVLVFTLLFAILEKTKVIGSNKQNNALISLAAGLILVATASARNVVVDLVPVFGIFAVSLLIILLLWGFVVQKDKLEIPKPFQTTILGLVIASVVVTILVSTGFWDIIVNFLKTEQGAIVNTVMVVAIIAAAFIVIKYNKSSGKD